MKRLEIQCTHKRGGCNCLKNAIAEAGEKKKPVFIVTKAGVLKITPKPNGMVRLEAA